MSVSNFIERFVKHMLREEIIKIPLTFVNEEFTTLQARKFLEYYEIDNMNKEKKSGRKLSERKKVFYT